MTFQKTGATLAYTGEGPIISAENAWEKLKRQELLIPIQGSILGDHISRVQFGYHVETHLSDASAQPTPPNVCTPVWIFYGKKPGTDSEPYPLHGQCHGGSMRAGLVWAFAVILLLGISYIVPGCVNSRNTSIKPVDMQCTFLDHASGITDYLSEYTSTSDGTVLYDWKAPSLYRMEYVKSQNPVTGSLFIMNHTTAVEYSPGEKTYHIEPDMKYLPQHDYQAMVRQIVKDGQYTIIGRDTQDGHNLLRD